MTQGTASTHLCILVLVSFELSPREFSVRTHGWLTCVWWGAREPAAGRKLGRDAKLGNVGIYESPIYR